jgi:hypothetical protein
VIFGADGKGWARGCQETCLKAASGQHLPRLLQGTEDIPLHTSQPFHPVIVIAPVLLGRLLGIRFPRLGCLLLCFVDCDVQRLCGMGVIGVEA